MENFTRLLKKCLSVFTIWAVLLSQALWYTFCALTW